MSKTRRLSSGKLAASTVGGILDNKTEPCFRIRNDCFKSGPLFVGGDLNTEGGGDGTLGGIPGKVTFDDDES